MLEQTGLIHWRCDAAAHQQGVDGRTPDTLTVHDGRWAYCPLDAGAPGHDWKPTGGVRIELLRRATPIIDLDAAPQPPAKTPSAPAARDAAAGTAAKKRTSPTKR